jgi:hypothetical protein
VGCLLILTHSAHCCAAHFCFLCQVDRAVEPARGLCVDLFLCDLAPSLAPQHECPLEQPDHAVVFDVFLDRRVVLVDINPFGEETDALLFSWSELREMGALEEMLAAKVPCTHVCVLLLLLLLLLR